MNVAANIDLRTEARACFDAGQWNEAAALFRNLERSSELSPNENVYLGVALTNLNKLDDAINRFDDRALSTSSMRKFVRRRAVVPQMQSKNFPGAEAVLKRLLEVSPDNVTNLGSLATVLVGEGKSDEAIACLIRAYRLDPQSTKLRNRVIRTCLRTGDVSAACRFALQEKDRWSEDHRFAHLSALALLRADKPDLALGAAEAIHLDPDCDAEAMATAAEVFLATAQPHRAMEVGHKVLHRKLETARIRLLMARASLKRGDDTSIAMHHLRRCRTLEPDHLPATELLADLLLQDGDFRSAADHLENVLRIDPKQIESRVKLGETWRFLQRQTEAAQVHAEALAMEPEPRDWKRQAVAALARVGREEEAQAAFDAFIQAKGSELPACLPAGLNILFDQTGKADIPASTLDWAWKISQNAPGERRYLDRTAWERMAKWGHLADKLITDWLECRPQESSELSDLFRGLDEVASQLEAATEDRKGAILVTAHLGPMHAGPLALQRLGIPHKWLGSMPKLSPLARDDSLISLSEQSDTDIAVAFNYALASGQTVVTALDGAPDPSAPTMRFEGQAIPYSRMAARAAYRNKAPAFFAMPYWKGGFIEFQVRPMPNPQPGETLEAFEARWSDAYGAHLKNGVALGPENLRLTGGLWRSIR